MCACVSVRSGDLYLKYNLSQKFDFMKYLKWSNCVSVSLCVSACVGGGHSAFKLSRTDKNKEKRRKKNMTL